MTEEIFNDLYYSGLVENYTKKLLYDCDDADDCVQNIWLQLLEVPDEKWERLEAEGKVRAYVSGLIYRNVRSKNSRLHYQLRRHKEYEVCIDAERWRSLEEGMHD